jgi:hypothetical protein
MAYRQALDAPMRYQWDADSRFPLPDPGTAPGNCGVTCVAMMDHYYNDAFHGIYATRRLAVWDDRKLSTSISEQKTMAEKRGVPVIMAQPSVAAIRGLLETGRRPILLGLDMSKVPTAVSGHPFRGNHAILFVANRDASGIVGRDPNFNRTYRIDPTRGRRYYPNWIIQQAFCDARMWALIPEQIKPVPALLPDTSIQPIVRIKGLPMSFRDETGHKLIVRAFKPLRDGASVSARKLTTTKDATPLRLWGRTKGQSLDGNDTWFFGPKFLDGRWRVVYTPAIDTRSYE